MKEKQERYDVRVAKNIFKFAFIAVIIATFALIIVNIVLSTNPYNTVDRIDLNDALKQKDNYYFVYVYDDGEESENLKALMASEIAPIFKEMGLPIYFAKYKTSVENFKNKAPSLYMIAYGSISETYTGQEKIVEYIRSLITEE